MERQKNAKAQQNIKYRLLACVVAVALAIGLSAMPALAEPSEDASGFDQYRVGRHLNGR